MFKGEYLNGKRWKGKAKFYNGRDYNYIYYSNGKINGKVKKYHSNNQLSFEGEYLNGEINGKGKEYDEDGELIFEGEYFEGKRWNGKGKEYNKNNILVFDGKYINGEKIFKLK